MSILDRDWRELDLVAVDVETTGFDPANDVIVQVGAVPFRMQDGPDQMKGFSWLVNHDKPIPESATKVHGLTTERVQTEGVAPVASVLWLLQFCAARVPVAYNASFDRRFLHRHIEAVVPFRNVVQDGWRGPLLLDSCWIDPLVWARAYYTGSRKLGDMAARLGITAHAHDALDDALVTAKLLHAVEPRLPRYLGDLLSEQSRVASRQ